jgi:WD40 repeat protein
MTNNRNFQLQGIVHSIVALGNQIYSASDDKTIRIWDLNKIECISVELRTSFVCLLWVCSRLADRCCTSMKIAL